jgi:hypothetical protein
MNTFGVISNGAHVDTSKTERGAKIYATKNGYNQISIRYNLGYNAEVIAEKLNGRWAPAGTANRLEELRAELRAERISYGELDELQSLAKYIDRSDVELLEAAGVPEKLNR